MKSSDLLEILEGLREEGAPPLDLVAENRNGSWAVVTGITIDKEAERFKFHLRPWNNG